MGIEKYQHETHFTALINMCVGKFDASQNVTKRIPSLQPFDYQEQKGQNRF